MSISRWAFLKYIFQWEWNPWSRINQSWFGSIRIATRTRQSSILVRFRVLPEPEWAAGVMFIRCGFDIETTGIWLFVYDIFSSWVMLGNRCVTVGNRSFSAIFFHRRNVTGTKRQPRYIPNGHSYPQPIKIWWWQPIVRNMDCHCCIQGNFKITKSNVILWNTLPLNAAFMTLW